MKVRYEPFGGIIALDRPSALVFVNKTYMQKLGYRDSPLWRITGSRLQSPTEIHFAVTNRCNQNCQHCYTESVNNPSDELTTKQIMRIIDNIADAGVFHIALGGGESFMRDDLFEIARYIRQKNMVPNLTTNGLLMDKMTAKKCNVFGQINVSIDSLGIDTNQPRKVKDITRIIEAVRILRKEKNRVGINLVVNRFNYSQIGEIIYFAKRERLSDIELLRLKPSGRALKVYKELCCTPEQHENFFTDIMSFARKYRQDIKIDCSYIPMACFHKPDKRLMEKFHIRGCDAGNVLASVDSSGSLKACSFASGNAGKISDFKQIWNNSEHFLKFTDWIKTAPEPCRSCNYLKLCLGGCHIVAEFITGSFNNADPECPFVYLRNKQFPL